MIEKLYYISQATVEKSHTDNIREVLEAGCRLVQLRIKKQTEDDVLKEAIKAKAVCDAYNAHLIINDFPKVAKEVDAYGIHVGLVDMAIADVRAIVGNNMIIGGTANTFEHIQQRVNEGADYIGLGPYRFTITKEKLSPILGLEGYHRILEQCKDAQINLPIVAIGGIGVDDVPALFETGVHTIAMSAALTYSSNKKEMVNKIQQAYAHHRQ
jgi:thiamine-phosphate pyrophosphorylase